MGSPAYGIMKLLRLLTVMVIFAAIITVFVYSPYYSKAALWMLEHVVSVQIDPIAAQSQQSGQLRLDSNLEPGSEEWVARRAYLYEVNHALKTGDVEQFVDLQLRYQQLLDKIETEKKQRSEILVVNPLNKQIVLNEEVVQETISSVDFYNPLLHDENEPLFQQYREYLRKDHNLLEAQQNIETNQVLSLPSEPLIFRRPADQPHAIVILGGGLTTGDKKGEIVVNSYTKKRLEQAVKIYQINKLPILLSGVEAPYMQKWLEQHQVKAQFLENRSMNTCENTRFSALLLQKQGGAPTVFLITDAYHMPRSQRLFALNGVATIPVVADLPNPLTAWQPDSQNLMHSRRATYEILASLRDLWFGESNCREIP